MSLLKQAYYGAAQCLPLSLLMKVSGNSSLFPYHHIVSDDVVPHIAHLYPYKNVAQFSKDLDTLLRLYKPIEPAELWQHIENYGVLPKRRFLLTFDDGFREVYNVIAPILKAKGVPAIFFINPAFIDNKKLFYRCKISLILHEITSVPAKSAVVAKLLETPDSFHHIRNALLATRQKDECRLDAIAAAIDLSFDQYLQAAKPWLTTTQLKHLSNQGFTIGGHSWDHPYYQRLLVEEQVSQTIRSCSFVAQTSPQPVCSFSFPHSDAGLSQNLFTILEEQYGGIDLFFGTQNQKDELSNKMIHRFNAERPHMSLRQQLPGLLLHRMLVTITGKNNIRRHTFLYDDERNIEDKKAHKNTLKEPIL